MKVRPCLTGAGCPTETVAPVHRVALWELEEGALCLRTPRRGAGCKQEPPAGLSGDKPHERANGQSSLKGVCLLFTLHQFAVTTTAKDLLPQAPTALQMWGTLLKS